MPLQPTDPHDEAPPLCWLHGFTQTGRSAHLFRDILTARRDLLAPDLPGHGTNTDSAVDLDTTADAVVAQWPAGPVDLGGYSLGGRLALHVALRHPTRVRRLVVLGATRGLKDPTARAARVARDDELAAQIEELGADEFIRRWLSQPMFVDLPDDEQERASRDGQRADALARSLRALGTGTQRWLGEELRTVTVPTLALAGLSDDRFAREARELATTIPGGAYQLIPGAGHAAHLHQPAWTGRVVNDFLDDLMHQDTRHDENHAEQ